MKVGILTISEGENYGNRLQNYASQEVLKSLGMQPYTIKNYTNQYITKYRIKEDAKIIISKLYKKINKINNQKLSNTLRYIKFKNFNISNIEYANEIVSKDNISTELNKKYDFFITGSDQVWNPEYLINSEIDFLTFADKKKRIAFSPSFGVSKLPENCKDNYKKWINGMEYLSVREQAGADIIKDLTGREAIVLLDPTLMLSKDEWMNIAKKPELNQDLNKKYILTYFLGNKSLEVENKINKIAKDNGLQIINLLDINDKYIYSVDPSEFIWLINNCELMCTDSFHGAVFSLIMKRPFIVFERKSEGASMNSRLETLLSKFDMECRLDKNICNNGQVFNVDFESVDRIINNEKEKTFNYLKNALNIK